MKNDLPYEEIEHMTRDITDWQLATLLHRCIWPTLSKRPTYTEPGLWQQVDSKEYNRFAEGARRFIEQYEKLLYDPDNREDAKQ